MAGLDGSGFTGKTVQEIKAEMDTAVRADISPTINTSSAGVVGNILGIISSALAELWELAGEVYASAFPDSASGAALDEVAAITGTSRGQATKSRVLLTVTTTLPNVTIPEGSIVSVTGDPTVRFATIAELLVVVAGTGSVFAESEEPGPVHGNAGTLEVIETPVAGWSAVTNALDAELGQDADDDEDLRLRRLRELAAQGTSPVDAIRGDLLRLEGVQSVSVFENVTDAVDVDGRPPHSIEAMVRGGEAAAIGAVIWADKAGGIRAFGDTPVLVLDVEGNTQTVYFSRPDEIAIYIEIDILKDLNHYPVDGDAQIEQAVADWGDEHQGVGADVVVSKLIALVALRAGVDDVVEVRVGTTPGPTLSANLAIAAREIATFDTSRIAVLEVP